jgi:hypothetical protein
MPERYRLLDRFSVIAGCLFPDDAAKDIEQFSEL